MAAYAVMARIGRADPHLTLHDTTDDDDGRLSGLRADVIEEAATLEGDRASDRGPLAERLDRMHELWRQTTFYLFDAESWRA